MGGLHRGHVSWVDVLRDWAERKPDACALRFLTDRDGEEAVLTFAELDRRARAIAADLQRLETAGERVLLLYHPGPDYVAAFFGCLYAGAVAVPAYPPDFGRLKRALPRLESIVADARPRLALTTNAIHSAAYPLIAERPLFREMGWLATDVTSGNETDWRMPSVGASSLAFLQYTSGSTGSPKGVMVSHGNLLHNARVIQHGFGHTDALVVVGWLPLYHDMGLIGNVLQPLFLGCPTTLLSPLAFLKRPLRWLETISRCGATTSGAPNFAYDLCVQKFASAQCDELDLSCWQVAFVGAEPVRERTLERFAATFAPHGFRRTAFLPCYGLAESTLMVAGGPPGQGAQVLSLERDGLSAGRVEQAAADEGDPMRLVACGLPADECEVVIADPERCVALPPGLVGEIWLRGPSVAQGYWNRPAETARVFQAALAGIAEGPFLRTGDLGFVRDGHLFVTGRHKDMLIVRGKNHYPQDIEQTVESCCDRVRPGCVAAFSVEVNGEESLVVAAEVVLRGDCNGSDPEQLVVDLLRAIVEDHDLTPHAIVLVPSGAIPKTTSGKLQRGAARAAYLHGVLGAIYTWALEDGGVATALHHRAPDDVYVGWTPKLGKLERRSMRYRFDLENDICWDRINEALPYLGRNWLTGFGIDASALETHPGAQELFQWAMALSTCETFIAVEEGLVRFLTEANALLPARSLTALEEEEEKHISLFRRYASKLRALHPELTARFDEAGADMMLLQKRIMDNSFNLKAAARHYITWLYALFLEEGTIHFCELLLPDRRSVQPTWLAAHVAHRAEEIQHVATDSAYVEALNLESSERELLSKLWFRVILVNFSRLIGLEPAYRMLAEQYPEQARAIASPVAMPATYLHALLYGRAFAKTRVAAPYILGLSKAGDAGWQEAMRVLSEGASFAPGLSKLQPENARECTPEMRATNRVVLEQLRRAVTLRERRALLVRYLRAEIAKSTRKRIRLEEHHTADVHVSRFGIDSLAAVQIAARLESDLGLEVPATAAYDNTLGELADQLLAGLGLFDGESPRTAARPTFAEIHGQGALLVRAADLRLTRFLSRQEFSTAQRAHPPASEASVLMLTGANGFLGRHLVLELAERLPKHGRLVCLVRAPDDRTAEVRLRGSYGSDSRLCARFDACAAQIEVRAGNITRSELGLRSSVYDRLCVEVGGIVHCAGVVNHVLTYEQLFEPNVLGTVNLMRFALRERIKAVHFASSVAVLAGLRRGRPVFEDERAEGLWIERPSRPLDGWVTGYATSKWASEVLLREFADRFAAPVGIFRCGVAMCHRSAAGQINPSCTSTMLLATIARMGAAPASFCRSTEAQAYLPSLPVDCMAAGIAAAVLDGYDGFRTFHVVDPERSRRLTLDRLVEWIQTAGYRVERLTEYHRWFERACEYSMAGGPGAIPIELLETWRQPFDPESHPELDATRFHHVLQRARLWSAAELNELLIHRALEYLAILGVVPPLSCPTSDLGQSRDIR